MSSKKKMRAKNLRIWNRRGFRVGPAGLFSILKADGWFAASRLPGGFRYLGGEPKAPESILAAKPMTQGDDGSQETTLRLQTIERSVHDHPLMRPALVVLAATMITSLLLWWTAFPRFH
jgi:hypothetical protein